MLLHGTGVTIGVGKGGIHNVAVGATSGGLTRGTCVSNRILAGEVGFPTTYASSGGSCIARLTKLATIIATINIMINFLVILHLLCTQNPKLTANS